MPLIVGEIKLDETYECSSKILENFPELKRKSLEFGAQSYTKFFKDDRVLYVGQHEFATIHSSDDSISYVGSDSATTCQIVVLKSLSSGACSLAHFDGSNIDEGLYDMLTSLKEFETHSSTKKIYELSVIGGFLDDRGISEETFSNIIRGAISLDAMVKLELACVCALNDQIVNDQHVPKMYGLGVSVADGKLFPVQQFSCPIPDETLRHAAMYSQKPIPLIYTSINKELTICPFQLNFPIREAKYRASLPDQIILKACSTSPHCEPDNFVKKLKEVYLFIAENPDILHRYFPDKKPRKHKQQNNGKWQLVGGSGFK